MLSNKKRCIVLFLLVLGILLLSSAASAKTQVYNDRLKSGESIDVDDFTFIITMNKYANAIFVNGGKIFQSVPLYGCKNMENFEVCFDNTTFDEEENDLFALVRIYRYKPDLTITRIMNDTEFYVGQEALVTLTLENKGDTASQIILTDDYPANVQISELEGGCLEHENQVYWQGHLDQDEKKECTFIIKPTKETHQSLVAHLKYWDGFKWVDKYSTTMTFDVNPVLEIFSQLVREDYEVDGTTFDFEEDNPQINIGETFRLIINVTNWYQDDVHVKAFNIILPPSLKYQSIGSLRFNYVNATGNRSSIVWYSDRVSKINEQTLRWDGTISTNKSSKLFILKLQAVRTGQHNIIIQDLYDYDDNLIVNDTTYESLDVGDPGLLIRMTLEDKSKLFGAPKRLDDEEDTIDLEALHPYTLRVYTQNKNKYSTLKNVDVKTNTSIAGFPKVHYDFIDEEGSKIPYSFVLIPAFVASDTDYKTNVSISYENEFGERHYNSSEFTLRVRPSKDLTIALDSSEGLTLDGGQETEVTVSIRNDRLIDLKEVTVKDTIPEDIYVEGVHAKKLKLNKESDTDVYKYTLKFPIVHNRTEYYILTTVSFFDPDSRQDINFTENTTITVEPFKPSLGVTATITKPDEIYLGTLFTADYDITNEEELEAIRDITITFPLQQEWDLLGPKTFFIDKLDPGEKTTLKGLVKFRPKIVNNTLQLNKTIVSYYDNYGNNFTENTTEETYDIKDSLISGPSISAKTITPAVINKSTPTTVRIDVRNSGTADTTVLVEQGGTSWTEEVPAGSIKSIPYQVKYDQEGNHTLSEPIIKFNFQGIESYTLGTGASFIVKYIEGNATVAQETIIQAPVEEVVQIEPEKEEIAFTEYEAEQERLLIRKIIKYGSIILISIIVFILAWLYIEYQKKKGPAVPFVETEGKE